jgi:hypothetical protein
LAGIIWSDPHRGETSKCESSFPPPLELVFCDGKTLQLKCCMSASGQMDRSRAHSTTRDPENVSLKLVQSWMKHAINERKKVSVCQIMTMWWQAGV